MRRREQRVGAQSVNACIGAWLSAAGQASLSALAEERILIAREPHVAVVDRIHSRAQHLADLDAIGTRAFAQAASLAALRGRVEMLVALQQRNVRGSSRARSRGAEVLVDLLVCRHRDD